MTVKSTSGEPPLPPETTGHEPVLGRYLRANPAVNGTEPELSGLRVRARQVNPPVILHTDDSAEFLLFSSLILAREGFRVEKALDGTSALRLAAHIQPDLIVTDIVKPDMSGLDFIRILKADEDLAHIPIVVLSAHFDQTVFLEAVALGAADYLSKPCTPEELLGVLNGLLQR